VLLEGLTHPDNVGSIFRSVACLGGTGILLDQRCADPLLRPTIRFSMGRVFSMPWTVAEDWASCLDSLRREGFVIVAAETCEGAAPPRDMPRDRDVALLVGSEGHGLSSESLAFADVVVRIQTPKAAETSSRSTSRSRQRSCSTSSPADGCAAEVGDSPEESRSSSFSSIRSIEAPRRLRASSMRW
ncbi:MAG: hypothetical protein RJA16_1544, partial [Planctomycetota bacterium]